MSGAIPGELVHAIPPEGEIEVAWRLDDTKESSTMMVERNASDVTFRENSFTIQVASPGVHQLRIIFTRATWHGRRYAL
jgi:two-component sensor histidine kinase